VELFLKLGLWKSWNLSLPEPAKNHTRMSDWWIVIKRRKVSCLLVAHRWGFNYPGYWQRDWQWRWCSQQTLRFVFSKLHESHEEQHPRSS
jgi:hypothetical protein